MSLQEGSWRDTALAAAKGIKGIAVGESVA